MNLSAEQARIIVDEVVARTGAYLVIVFGTGARGNFRPDSDIDIAFAADQGLSGLELYETACELGARLNRDVHLIDFMSASTVLQAQIVTTGRPVYCRDETRRMVLFMTALKKYARLNEERQPVLAKIKERGSVYAR